MERDIAAFWEEKAIFEKRRQTAMALAVHAVGQPACDKSRSQSPVRVRPNSQVEPVPACAGLGRERGWCRLMFPVSRLVERRKRQSSLGPCSRATRSATRLIDDARTLKCSRLLAMKSSPDWHREKVASLDPTACVAIRWAVCRAASMAIDSVAS